MGKLSGLEGLDESAPKLGSRMYVVLMKKNPNMGLISITSELSEHFKLLPIWEVECTWFS